MAESDEGASPSKIRKLSKSITEISSEADSSLVDMEAQTALEDIDACQNEIDALNEKASEEILLIEQKYNKLRKPHYEKRNELIKQIPNFWVTSYVNHPQISHVVSPTEEKCLQYLTQMEVSEFEDIKSGYCLSFHFAKNPYFSNEKISKSYFLTVKDGRPHSKSTEIQWKDGKDLSKQVQSKKLQSRVPGVGPRVGSFFSWFTENGSPLNDKIADILKDDIWPNPLQYYLAPDIEVEENGHTDDDDDDDSEGDGDSVVIVGDDDSDIDDLEDDNEVYEVDDHDDTGDIADESIEFLEVEDEEDEEDDDDDVELIESDSELETTAATNTSQDEKDDSAASEGLSKPRETSISNHDISCVSENVNEDTESKTESADEHKTDNKTAEDSKTNKADKGDNDTDAVNKDMSKTGGGTDSVSDMVTNENSGAENEDQSEAEGGKGLVTNEKSGNKTDSKVQDEEGGGGGGDG